MLVLGINKILNWCQITTGWGTYTCPIKEVNGEMFFKLKKYGTRWLNTSQITQRNWFKKAEK